MKAKITQNGYLEVMRAGKWKPQECIHRRGTVCGDWCPFFDEIYSAEKIRTIALECSQRSISFRAEGDER